MAKTPSKTKQKLTAVFVTDVAAYSRLMGADDETTIETLTAYRTVFSSHIQQLQGRVVNAPVVSILAEFSSVVDAVSCAVGMHREQAETFGKPLDVGWFQPPPVTHSATQTCSIPGRIFWGSGHCLIRMTTLMATRNRANIRFKVRWGTCCTRCEPRNAPRTAIAVNNVR